MNHTLQTFTTLVHKMRLAQERYFDLAKEARKTGHHKKEQKDALVISKNLEKQVDEAIQEINKHVSDTNVGDIGKRTEKQIDSSYFATENF